MIGVWRIAGPPHADRRLCSYLDYPLYYGKEIFTNRDCFFPERRGACGYSSYKGIQEGGI